MKKIFTKFFNYQSLFWICITASVIIINVINFIFYKYHPIAYVLGINLLVGAIVLVTIIAINITKRERYQKLIRTLVVNGDIESFKEQLHILIKNDKNRGIQTLFFHEILVLLLDVISDYQNISLQTFVNFEKRFAYILNNLPIQGRLYYICKTLYVAQVKTEDYQKYYNSLVINNQDDEFISKLREAALYLYNNNVKHHEKNGIINYWNGNIIQEKITETLNIPQVKKICLPLFIINIVMLTIVAITQIFYEINIEYHGVEYYEMYEANKEQKLPLVFPQKHNVFEYEEIDFFYKYYDVNNYFTESKDDDYFHEFLVLKYQFDDENFAKQLYHDQQKLSFTLTKEYYKDFEIYHVSYSLYRNYSYHTFGAMGVELHRAFYCLNYRTNEIIYINFNSFNFDYQTFDSVQELLPEIWKD